MLASTKVISAPSKEGRDGGNCISKWVADPSKEQAPYAHLMKEQSTYPGFRMVVGGWDLT